MHSVLWWVAFVVCGGLTVIYGIALYFTYWDNPKEFERTFSNNQRVFEAPKQMRNPRKRD
jgi:hypothetical protein